MLHERSGTFCDPLSKDIYMSASCEPGCVWQLLVSGAVRLWAHTSCTVSDGVARGVETAVGMYSCCYVMWLFIRLPYVDGLSYISLCM